MPYIKENARTFLDGCVCRMIECLTDGNRLSDQEFMQIAGEINYVFSRIITASMGEISYSKIAVATGVLENIKQELYRRVATPYEEKKITENGDIKEYKNVLRLQ